MQAPHAIISIDSCPSTQVYMHSNSWLAIDVFVSKAGKLHLPYHVWNNICFACQQIIEHKKFTECITTHSGTPVIDICSHN